MLKNAWVEKKNVLIIKTTSSSYNCLCKLLWKLKFVLLKYFVKILNLFFFSVLGKIKEVREVSAKTIGLKYKTVKSKFLICH